ncbi:MAG: DUF2911 domain-containing protein [Bryobacteraceae bacterium]|jgi:hypothetical protein
MLRPLFAVLLGAGWLLAQGYTSPAASTSVTIDGKTIRIDYHAPSMHGRKIFGGLEAYGRVWRAGANQATAFHTDAELDLGGLKVPQGDYTLFVYLDPKQWKLVVNKQTGQWGLAYDEAQDLGRVAMNMSKPLAAVETWKITLSQAGPHAGKLRMEWENTVAEVPFTVR